MGFRCTLFHSLRFIVSNWGILCPILLSILSIFSLIDLPPPFTSCQLILATLLLICGLQHNAHFVFKENVRKELGPLFDPASMVGTYSSPVSLSVTVLTTFQPFLPTLSPWKDTSLYWYQLTRRPLVKYISNLLCEWSATQFTSEL